MFELYGTGMKTQQKKKKKKKNCLFVTYTVIQSITSSEMCSLHLTHPRAHTPGAVGTHTHTPGVVDTHTHTHTWSSGHTHTHTHLEQWTHTHTPGAVDTHTHTWSSGQSTLRRPGTSIRPRLPLDYNLQLYCKLFHIQCGSVKSNAILIKIHKHI